MIRRLIILLLIVGCEEAVAPEDCAGVSDGTAVEDDYGVCNGIDGYVTGSCYDCADIPNGDAEFDNCGVCDADTSNDCTKDECGVWGGNNSPNTGICDCAGVPNGDNVVDNCGICDEDSSNDCVQDCADVWGGNVVEDCSGICGSNLTDQNGDGLCDEWIELTVIDVDGNIYNTIQIGYQLWMAENLKVTHYRDGTPIITGLSQGEWYDLDEIEAGAYVVYDDDPSNTDIYGNLYNWYVVDDDRGVCPEDFHVPSDEEWMELEVFLGMREEETTDGAGRGTDEGAKLAGNSDLWNNGVTTNSPEFGSSGFSALPGGKKHQLGSCYQMGSEANFWSSSKPYNSALTAWKRGVNSDVTTVYRMTWGVRWGLSIRCLQD